MKALGVATVLMAAAVVLAGIINHVVEWWRARTLRGHDLDVARKIRPNVKRVK
jgi:hypothetical protein